MEHNELILIDKLANKSFNKSDLFLIDCVKVEVVSKTMREGNKMSLNDHRKRMRVLILV